MDFQTHIAEEAGVESGSSESRPGSSYDSLMRIKGDDPISPARATVAAITSNDRVTEHDGSSAKVIDEDDNSTDQFGLKRVVSTDEIEMEDFGFRESSSEGGPLGVDMPETIGMISGNSEFSDIYEGETYETVAEPNELTDLEPPSEDRGVANDSGIHVDVSADRAQDNASEARFEAVDVNEEDSQGLHEAFDGSETTRAHPETSASVKDIDIASISNPDDTGSSGVIGESFPRFRQEDILVEPTALPRYSEPVDLLDSSALPEWSNFPSSMLATLLTCLAFFFLRRKRTFGYRQCCCTKFLQQRKASRLEGTGPDSSAEESVTTSLSLAKHQLGQIRYELSQMREERNLVDMELVNSSAQILNIISTPPLPDSIAYTE